MDQATTTEYTNLIDFKNDTTILLIRLDQYISFLNSIPNQSDAIVDTQKTLISINYKNFYVINNNTITLVTSMLSDYTDTANLYGIDISILKTLSNTVQPLSNVDSYPKVTSQKASLITTFTTVKTTIITAILNPINQQIRVLTGNDVGKTNIDGKQPLNKNSTFLYKSSHAQYVNPVASTNVSPINVNIVRQQDAQKLTQYIKDWINLKPLTDLLTNPTSLGGLVNSLVTSTTTVASWINQNILQSSSVTATEKQSNFFFSNLLTGKGIVKAQDPTTQSNADQQAMWREQARKRFGNFPFCDEYPTQINGKWVVKDAAASQTAINIAKKQLLLKMLKQKPYSQ